MSLPPASHLEPLDEKLSRVTFLPAPDPHIGIDLAHQLAKEPATGRLVVDDHNRGQLASSPVRRHLCAARPSPLVECQFAGPSPCWQARKVLKQMVT